jgi:hypothetical protein
LFSRIYISNSNYIIALKEEKRVKDIKDYVCTLEQAKRLAELNVNQDSLYYYALDETSKAFCVVDASQKETIKVDLVCSDDGTTVMSKITAKLQKQKSNINTYSAFTSQEIEELISNITNTLHWSQGKNISHKVITPISTRLEKSNPQLISFFSYVYSTEFKDLSDQVEYKITSKCTNEAQARAEFLIYLLENKEK